jgi:hypothetical protein
MIVLRVHGPAGGVTSLVTEILIRSRDRDVAGVLFQQLVGVASQHANRVGSPPDPVIKQFRHVEYVRRHWIRASGRVEETPVIKRVIRSGKNPVAAVHLSSSKANKGGALP